VFILSENTDFLALKRLICLSNPTSWTLAMLPSKVTNLICHIKHLRIQKCFHQCKNWCKLS